MRILVVGGLGYLGSIITNELGRNYIKHEVHVVDCCLYENEYVKPLIKCKKHYFNHFVDKTDFDVVVWCAHTDSAMLHTSTSNKMEKFIEDTKRSFKSYVKQSKKFINCSSFVAGMNKDSLNKDYFLELENYVYDHKHLNIRIPSLHGPSLRMRWDTFINSIIYQAVTQKSIELGGDHWIQQIPFANVFDAAQFVVKQIFMEGNIGTYDYFTEMYSLIEAAHLLFHDKEIPITVSQQAVQSVYLNGFSIENRHQASKNMWHSFEDIMTNLKSENNLDFMSEKYNNEEIVNAGIIGFNFLKKIGI